MNILVPDSWLRAHLKTKATPEKIKENLSLCGPSVERIGRIGKEVVYDVEITSNRPDMMSIIGIAREAAAILPRFGIKAELTGDPYKEKVSLRSPSKHSLFLKVKTDPALNPRWTSVVFDEVTIKDSPDWLKKRLELVGIRAINNVIDITNYLMHAYGQPAHVFDYDAIKGHQMTLRESRKGEKLTTLDGKTHTLPGRDIVIADGSGKLIDLCGIMGGKNSAVKPTTNRVILFLQTYDPVHIRKTSMALAHRTEAAGLFEKGLDPELVWPVFCEGVRLMSALTSGHVASTITDLYPHPYKKTTVSVKREKVNSYLGVALSDKEIRNILESVGFGVTVTKELITVGVPSFRRDIMIDVDIIEEIARLYGYHNITSQLPTGELPMTEPDTLLRWEDELKIRLRDWGFTELVTYSMISENLMDIFGLDKTKAYKISNPLSDEWVYMRPTLWPNMLLAIKQNINHQKSLRLFEIGNAYLYRDDDLPQEEPVLIMATTGKTFREIKGIAEAIFALFGLELPEQPQKKLSLHNWDDKIRLLLGGFGSVSEVNPELLNPIGINQPVIIFWVHLKELVRNANPAKSFRPIPKYPPVVEDLSFIVPDRFEIGPLIDALKSAHRLVANVTLLDVHENTRTLHVEYQDPKRNLTNEEIVPIHEKLVRLAEEKFGVTLKT